MPFSSTEVALSQDFILASSLLDTLVPGAGSASVNAGFSPPLEVSEVASRDPSNFQLANLSNIDWKMAQPTLACVLKGPVHYTAANIILWTGEDAVPKRMYDVRGQRKAGLTPNYKVAF